LFAETNSFEFAQQVSDRSITLVKNSGKLLPLNTIAGAEASDNK